MPLTSRDAEWLESLVLEIHRVAVEFDRFGRSVKGEREHPGLQRMSEEFERIGNKLSEASTERRPLGKARYGELAESFENIARLIRESAEHER
jgi:hypothetical protein